MVGKNRGLVDRTFFSGGVPDEGAFVVIKTNKDPMNSLGWPKIERAISNITPTMTESVKSIKGGQLLVKTTCEKQTKAFLSQTTFGGLKANISLHETLSYTKGSVYAPDLIDIPINKLKKWMKYLRVTEVRRPLRPAGERRSPVLMLTFSRLSCPTELKFHYIKYDVQPWYPKSTLCDNCGHIGHKNDKCTKPLIIVESQCRLVQWPVHEAEKLQKLTERAEKKLEINMRRIRRTEKQKQFMKNYKDSQHDTIYFGGIEWMRRKNRRTREIQLDRKCRQKERTGKDRHRGAIYRELYNYSSDSSHSSSDNDNYRSNCSSCESLHSEEEEVKATKNTASVSVSTLQSTPENHHSLLNTELCWSQIDKVLAELADAFIVELWSRL